MKIENIIKSRLQEIENEYDVKILLAVESGSRAWGFASAESDYDVRFVYVNHRNWYLSLKEGRDVIEWMDPTKIYDLAGWDLKKTLILMSRCNCSFAEWLNSPIVYYRDEQFFNEITALKELYFNPIKAIYNYYRIAHGRSDRYLSRYGYQMKRYMYTLRGLLSALWVEDKMCFPPVLFSSLVDNMVTDRELHDEIMKIVALKKRSKEHDKVEVCSKLIEYVEFLTEHVEGLLKPERLAELSKCVSKVDYSPLDKLLLETIDRFDIQK